MKALQAILGHSSSATTELYSKLAGRGVNKFRNTVTFDGGGLGRQLRVYRLPEVDWSRHVAFDHNVSFDGGPDLPVYLRVTQADGHQAWSSPIYLIE